MNIIVIATALMNIYRCQDIWDIKPNNSSELQLQLPFKDALKVKDFKVYELNLAPDDSEKLANKTMVFSLMPFSGSPSLSVHCDKRLKLAEFFEWQSGEDFHQEIVITAEERKRLNCSDKLFYVGVATLHPTQFILSSILLNGQTVTIDFFLPASGEVLGGEIVTYNLNVYDFENIIEINAQLDSSSGNTKMFIKRFKTTHNEVECKITQQDIDNQKKLHDSGFFLIANSTGKNIINFIHNPIDCKEDDERKDSVCTYVIGVYGDPLHNKSQYRLIIKRNQTHTPLRETVNDWNYVNDGQQRYYVFQVPNGSEYQIDKVKFQLSVEHGSVSMFVSRTEQYPSLLHAEKKTIKDFVVYQQEKDGDLDTNYYICIQGNSLSQYSLYAAIQRIGETVAKDLDFILLSRGTPQTHTVLNLEEDSFFKLKLFYNKSQPNHMRPNVTILLRPTRGNYKMFLSDNIKNGAPNGINAVWSTHGRQLTINNNDPKYAEIIYITVQGQDVQENFYDYTVYSDDDSDELVWQRPTNNSDNTLKQFQIGYRLSGNIQNSKIGEQIIDVVKSSEPLYYKFLLQGYQDIQITKTIYSSNAPQTLEIFISVNQDVQKPNRTHHDLTLVNDLSVFVPASKIIACEEYEEHKFAESYKKQGTNTQQTRDDLAAQGLFNFKNKLETHKSCYLYIAVYSNESTFFSINTHLKDSFIPLYEGLPQYFSFADATQIKRFFFVPFYHEDITIMTHSPGLQLEIFVKISRDNSLVNDNEPKNTWTYPNKYVNDFQSLENDGYSSNHIVIPYISLVKNGCANKTQMTCVITLTVLVNTTTQINQYSIKQTFSISATQRNLQLFLSTPVVGYVPKDAMVYYTAYITQNVSSILIACTSLNNGDPDIFISKGHDQRPTQNNFTWSSQGYRSDQVIIEGANLAGEYVIGVYGYQESVFQIVYSTGNFSYFKIHPGQPYDVVMKAGQTFYYDLDYYSSNTIKIVLNRMAGHPSVQIKTYKENSQLPHEVDNFKRGKPTWTNVNKLNSDIITIMHNDTHFCTNCHYLIAIHSLQQDAQFTLEVYEQYHHMTIQSGRITRDFLKQGEFSLFRYHTLSDFKIFVNVYSGNVRILVKKAYNITDDKVADQVAEYTTGNYEMSVSTTVKDSKGSNRRMMYVILQQFYVMKVIAISNTNYTISVLQDRQKLLLNWARPHHTTLAPNDYQIYTLQSTTKKPNQFITLAFNYQSTWGINRIGDVAANVIISHRNHKESSDKNKEIQVFKTYTFQEAQLFRILDVDGIYDIMVDNNKPLAISEKISLNFRIFANQKDLNILLPKVPMMNSVQLGMTDVYEIFIESPSRLFIEAFTCGGKILIRGSSNYYNIKQQNYEISLQEEANSHIVGVIDVKQGMYYLAVKSLYQSFQDKNGGLPETTYVIKVQQFPENEVIPYDHFFQPDHGKLTYKVKDENLEISLPSIQLIKDLSGTDLKITRMFYGVIFTKETHKMDELMQCNFDRLIYEQQPDMIIDTETHYHWRFKRVFTNDTSYIQTFSLPLKDLKDTKLHLVKGIAKILLTDSKGNVEELTFPYEPIELYDIHSQSYIFKDEGFSKWWLVLILVFSIGASVALFVFVKRYLWMRKQINYEMQDVKNIASTQSVEMNYQGFNEQK